MAFNRIPPKSPSIVESIAKLYDFGLDVDFDSEIDENSSSTEYVLTEEYKDVYDFKKPRDLSFLKINLPECSPPDNVGQKVIFNTPCKFFLNGMCIKGENCKFLHNFEEIEKKNKPPKKTENEISNSFNDLNRNKLNIKKYTHENKEEILSEEIKNHTEFPTPFYIQNNLSSKIKLKDDQNLQTLKSLNYNDKFISNCDFDYNYNYNHLNKNNLELEKGKEIFSSSFSSNYYYNNIKSNNESENSKISNKKEISLIDLNIKNQFNNSSNLNNENYKEKNNSKISQSFKVKEKFSINESDFNDCNKKVIKRSKSYYDEENDIFIGSEEMTDEEKTFSEFSLSSFKNNKIDKNKNIEILEENKNKEMNEFEIKNVKEEKNSLNKNDKIDSEKEKDLKVCKVLDKKVEETFVNQIDNNKLEEKTENSKNSKIIKRTENEKEKVKEIELTEKKTFQKYKHFRK